MGVGQTVRSLLGKIPGGKARRWILPGLAMLILLGLLFSDSAGFVEIEPGEVGVIYNQTGFSVFGDDAKVVIQQGVLSFIPVFQRVEVLDMRPQIFVMEGDRDQDHNHVARLTVRASDGSNFNFQRLEIHYQLRAAMAAEVITNNGPGDEYKWRAVRVHSREVLRDVFGAYSFEEIADPRTYGKATADAKWALNARLNPLGIEVTNIPPPKPQFDPRIESAIEDRQNSEQEVEVQEEKRNKLRLEKGRRVQGIQQTKSAEYQQLLANLEAAKRQAQNKLISVKREADKYYIERHAEGQALRDEQVVRAKANEVAFRKSAEGLVAKIKAVGEQGPDVLNREIAEYIFPQLKRLRAVPYTRAKTPIDIRYLKAPGEGN